jgi:hypothetical protein
LISAIKSILDFNEILILYAGLDSKFATTTTTTGPDSKSATATTTT